MKLEFSEIRRSEPFHATGESSSSAHLKMHVLASGSRGNATIIEETSSGRALLVDCGICKREFFDRCKEVGVDYSKIEGILITHEHTDHTKGLGVVTRGLAKEGINPVLYTSSAVKNSSSELIAIQKCCDIRYFRAGDSLSVSGMQTQVFATSHDAVESFGFRFEGCGKAEENNKNGEGNKEVIGYITDTGIVTPQAYEALAGCRILALESNHDTRMLETGPYPFMLKRRVASDKGHLSNAQAAATLEELLCNELEQVVAMHISENNNTYRLPWETLAEVLERNDHSAKTCSAYQHRVISIE